MKLKVAEKIKVIELRQAGHSLSEIVNFMHSSHNAVSKSSVSTWVRNVELSNEARSKLRKKISLGQVMGAEARRDRTKTILNRFRESASDEISKIELTRQVARLLCALIYMCEGRKNYFNGVTFTNSDPKLVSLFLGLFRRGYDLDEKKFRVCVHIHEYHNKDKQIAFWSKITKIPRKQFTKPYLKPNTGIRIRTGYQGCASVRYHSNDMVKRLLSYSESFLKGFGIE